MTRSRMVRSGWHLYVPSGGTSRLKASCSLTSAYRVNWSFVTKPLRLLIALILLFVALAWCTNRDEQPEPASHTYSTLGATAWQNPSWNASPAAAPVIKTPTKHVHRKTTRASRSRSVRHGSASTATTSSSVWDLLAQCESGGNPRTNTGNGYYGLYQFSLGTWRSVGGSGLPSDASPAEQTKRAKILQARSGWGQWPACSRKLGLR